MLKIWTSSLWDKIIIALLNICVQCTSDNYNNTLLHHKSWRSDIFTWRHRISRRHQVNLSLIKTMSGKWYPVILVFWLRGWWTEIKLKSIVWITLTGFLFAWVICPTKIKAIESFNIYLTPWPHVGVSEVGFNFFVDSYYSYRAEWKLKKLFQNQKIFFLENKPFGL